VERFHSEGNEEEYPKLVHWPNWEVPAPGKEAIIGFFVTLAISLALHGFLLWLSSLFRQT